jgi:hypothetical protein
MDAATIAAAIGKKQTKKKVHQLPLQSATSKQKQKLQLDD